MEFSSIEELSRYVEIRQAKVMDEIGEEMKKIMKDETDRQVNSYDNSMYQNTGDVIDCIDITMISNDFVEVSWQDNGGWMNLSEDNHMYAPWALENGTSFGRGSTPYSTAYRPSTNFVEVSKDKIEIEIPREYKRIMNGLGIPLK